MTLPLLTLPVQPSIDAAAATRFASGTRDEGSAQAFAAQLDVASDASALPAPSSSADPAAPLDALAAQAQSAQADDSSAASLPVGRRGPRGARPPIAEAAAGLSAGQLGSVGSLATLPVPTQSALRASCIRAAGVTGGCCHRLHLGSGRRFSGGCADVIGHGCADVIERRAESGRSRNAGWRPEP